MKFCLKCKKEIESSIKTNFCSRSCANSRVWTKEDRIKKSIAAKNSLKVLSANKKTAEIIKKPKIHKICNCGKSFSVIPSHKLRKYCSVECVNKYAATGGYRKNSGRGKSGYYKGIYCNSTYELQWVIYHIDHNIPVQRFKGYLTDGTKKYYPDFIDPNNNKKIIEIKGFADKNDLAKKIKIAIDSGYEIEVLFKEHLKYIFDYVKIHYGHKKIYELYDNFKPQYVYQCKLCTKNFSKEKKIKTETFFCSRSCSMKYNSKKRIV